MDNKLSLLGQKFEKIEGANFFPKSGDSTHSESERLTFGWQRSTKDFDFEETIHLFIIRATSPPSPRRLSLCCGCLCYFVQAQPRPGDAAETWLRALAAGCNPTRAREKVHSFNETCYNLIFILFDKNSLPPEVNRWRRCWNESWIFPA